MTNNPLSPAESAVADREAPPKLATKLIAGLALGQILFSALSFWSLIDLVLLRAIPGRGPILSVVSDVVLAISVLLFATKSKSKLLFLLPGLGFLFASVLLWHEPISPITKHMLASTGLVVCLFAWWSIRNYETERKTFQTQA